MNDKKCFKCNGTGKMKHPYGSGGKDVKGMGCRYCGGTGKATYKADKGKLKKFVKEVLNSMNEVAPEGWERTVKSMKKHKNIVNPWALANWMKSKGMKSHKNEVELEKKDSGRDSIGRDECSECGREDELIYTHCCGKSLCPDCLDKHDQKYNYNESHGDVHYWGAQPKDKQHKISTGYDGTVPLKENMTDKKALRKLIIEAAKEVINEYQHEQPHEQQEMAQFKMIQDRVGQLMQMHQRGAYDETKELELVRQIKKIAIEIEASHTGTKITTNEKVQ